MRARKKLTKTITPISGEFSTKPEAIDLSGEIDFLESLRGDGIGPGQIDNEIGLLYKQHQESQDAIKKYEDEVKTRRLALTVAENSLARTFSTDRFGMPINLDWNADSTVTSGFLKETEPHISEFIDQMFQDVGASPGRGKQIGLGKDEDGNEKQGLPWSAVTIYRLAVPYYGKTAFPKSDAHSDYIGAAMKGEGPLKASELKSGSFEPKMGQILFRGRDGGRLGDTSKWSFKKFKRKAGSYYPSHGDIVTDTGVDEKGRYVVVSGGNVKNTFLRGKLYLDELYDAGYRGIIHDDSNDPYN